MDGQSNGLLEEDDTNNFELEFCDLCDGILAEIPQTSTFLRQQITLQCVDASETLVGLGTNIGNLFLYNRKMKKVSKFGGPFKSVSKLKCYSGPYDVVATGHTSGAVVLLRLPSAEPAKSRKLCQHSMEDLHRHEIRALEWSPDGTKLFTGDGSGLVTMTICDFDANVFHSTFVCCEESSIVQLTYRQSKLAVSTLERAVLVDLVQQCAAEQIGAAKRKITGSYGITYLRHFDNISPSPADSVLVTSRPGFRLWICDEGGEVRQTLMFREFVDSAPNLPLPISIAKETSFFGAQEWSDFGALHYLNSEHLVSHGLSQMYILNPARCQIVAKVDFVDVKRLFIKDVSVCSGYNEIFLLLGDRHLLRISSTPPQPELIYSKAQLKKNKGVTFASTLVSRLSNENTVVNKIRAAAPSNEQMAQGWKGIEKLFQSPSYTPRRTPSASYMSERTSLCTDDQSYFDELEARTQLEPEEPDAVVNVTSVKPKAQQQPEESSWRDSVVTVVDSMGGLGAAVETGDFENTTPPPEADLSRVSPSKTTESVVVLRKKKGKRTKTKSSNRNSDSSEYLSATEQVNDMKSNGNGVAENVVEAVESAPVPEFVDFEIDQDSVDRCIGEIGMTRADLERLLDSTIVEQESERIQRLQGDEHSDNEPATLTYEPEPDTLVHTLVCNQEVPSAQPYAQVLQLELGKQDAKSEPEQVPYLDVEITPEEEAVAAQIVASSLDSDTALFNERLLNSKEQLDIWCQLLLSDRILCVAACSNYLCYLDAKSSIYYASLNDGLWSWQIIEETADSIAIGGDGKLVWRLCAGTAFALVRPSPWGPVGSRWVEAARFDIVSVALNSNTAWYLRADGEVCVQRHLTPDRPCYRVQVVDCDWRLVQLAVSDEAVWGLKDDGRLVVRIQINEDHPIGTDWVDVSPHGPSELVSISLFGQTGWVVDVRGRLWFTTQVDNKNPFGRTGRWWQVSSPSGSMWGRGRGSVLNALPQLCASSCGLYLSSCQHLHITRGAVSGHRWKHPIPPRLHALDDFRRIDVGGLYDTHTDCVWLLRPKGELFGYRRRNLVSLPPIPSGNKPVYLTSSLGTLWVLDEKGNVFIRSGIDGQLAPIGVDWVQLDLAQLGDVHLTIISCSLESVWALDASGCLWVRVGTCMNEPGGMTSAWVQIDTPKLNARDYVKKVHTSPDGSAVWILCSSCRVFVRLGVTESLPVGQHWAEVQDMLCVRLALGSRVVWALDSKRTLWRRHGINEANAAGDYWKIVPGSLRHIHVTAHNRLWGLDERRRLVRHQVKIYSPPVQGKDEGNEGDEDEDYELI